MGIYWYVQHTYSPLPMTICDRGPKETALDACVTREWIDMWSTNVQVLVAI